MKKLFSLAAALTLSVAAFAQKGYVSTPLVEAIESGKYYMKLSMDMGGRKATLETASRAGVTMSRVSMPGMNAVTLTAAGHIFQLDEKAKTWRSGMGLTPMPGHMTFVRQGTCKLNGKAGWYFDEYSSDGTTITFYYNSDKVAIIDLGDPQMGPMALQSFSPTIPKNMYFCVGNDWKGSGIAPPRCSSPWVDNGPAVELACGSGLGSISISAKQTGSVSLASVASTPETTAARTDMNVTPEGIRKAFVQLQKESKGKTSEQIAGNIMDFNAKAGEMMVLGVVTGEMIEMAIARCKVYPHPSLLTTTGNMLLVAEDPKTALEYFEEASKLQPDFEEPLYGQVECLLDMGQVEKARKVVPKIIEVTTRRREPDGKAWLYKALLDAQRSPVEAAGALFKSLGLGYFGENSVSLISSLLNEIDRAEMNASLDKQDFMSLIDNIFTPENLENIRKGVTYGYDDYFPADEASFSATPAGDLEANRTNNARIAGDYEGRSNQHWAKAEKAVQKGPSISLLYTMEAAYLPDNMSRLIEEAKNRPETQSAMQNYADARKEIAKIGVPEKLRAGLEQAYVKLTQAQCFEHNVDGFYLFDARAFWCLRLLERYYKYRLDYAYGTFGEFDEETHTFRGFLPEGLKNNILKHVKRTAQDISLGEAMDKRQFDEALALNKKCTAEFDAWCDAHPDASDAAIERAQRRIFRPYRILTEVTHPLERLNQIEVPSETEKVNADMICYNSTIRPVLAQWWQDISKYCSYCSDAAVSNYFWYRTLSAVYGEYSATFSSKATVGELLHETRQRILKAEASIKEEQWQDHQEAIAEHEQAEKDARDLAEFKGRQWYGLSDLFLSMLTPMGEISVGLKEGKWGFHLDVEKSYVRPEPLDVKKVGSSILTDENVNSTIQATIQSAADAMGVGGMPAGNVILGMRALSGRLIDTKDETKYNISRDSAGNMLIQKTNSRKYDLAGAGTVTSENIQVGRIKARRDVVTYGFGGFFSVSGGSTVIRK